MWFSMVMNGAVLSAVIICVYILALLHYCDGMIFQSDINTLPDYNNKLMDARTVAFISLVWSENVRSYTSRSFNKPVWVNLFGNPQMQKAIVLAQIALYVAVLVPVFSDSILKLSGVSIGIFGWGVALLGPIGCVVLCELCKLITALQMRNYQQSLALRRASEDQAPMVKRKTSKYANAQGELAKAQPVARKATAQKVTPKQQPKCCFMGF